MSDKTDDAREALGGLCVILRASGIHASLIDDDKATVLKALDRKAELEEVLEHTASVFGFSKEQLIEAYRLNCKLKEYDKERPTILGSEDEWHH